MIPPVRPIELADIEAARKNVEGTVLMIGFGRFGHYDADGESGSLAVDGTTSVRLKFGVTWRPTGRRGVARTQGSDCPANPAAPRSAGSPGRRAGAAADQ